MAFILVIEDDSDVRGIIAKALIKAGHTVRTASDGSIGTRMFREDPAELIITDMIMPEMEGAETIINIRTDYPDAKIIAISGGSASLDSSVCLRISRVVGAVRTLSKPFTMSALVETVNELLAEK